MESDSPHPAHLSLPDQLRVVAFEAVDRLPRTMWTRFGERRIVDWRQIGWAVQPRPSWSLHTQGGY